MQPPGSPITYRAPRTAQPDGAAGTAHAADTVRARAAWPALRGAAPLRRAAPRPVRMSFVAPVALVRAEGSAPRAPARPAEFVLLGTGVSTALPRVDHVIKARPKGPCRVCQAGMADAFSPNRRCNVCALVRLDGRTVLVDCGKTIRESALRHFPALGVSCVDAIVLTHGHADAILGLDDLRDLQGGSRKRPTPTPVFLNANTLSDCKRVFPYLMPGDVPIDPATGKADIRRRIAVIDWIAFEEETYFQPFSPLPGVGITFTPVPLIHGGDYICMGFIIEVRSEKDAPASIIAYLSDVSLVPETTMAFLECLPTIDVLIIDALTPDRSHPSHFNLEEAIDLARKLKPVKTFTVGMTCSVGMHEDVNVRLAEMQHSEGLHVALGHDGLRIPL